MDTQQSAEGALIERALKLSGLSARKASTQAGISDARWRHIVNGYQPAGRGQVIPVTAPAGTLARMARVVGVTAAQLREAGRGDAAALLDREPESDHDPDVAAIENHPGFTREEKDLMLAVLHAKRGQSQPVERRRAEGE